MWLAVRHNKQQIQLSTFQINVCSGKIIRKDLTLILVDMESVNPENCQSRRPEKILLLAGVWVIALPPFATVL